MIMAKLNELKLEGWFTNKDRYLLAALANNAYEYEIIGETEKAIQIKIISKDWSKYEAATKNWTKWIPKSAIIK
jgi:hypothetical protein